MSEPITLTSFDPRNFLVVPERRFPDLKIGDIFRAPSRTLTDAHAAAFQTVSADNHPVHYDSVWATRHDKGTVTTAVTIYNQHDVLVLSGRHKYVLKS